MDETDTAFNVGEYSENLRCILNAGHRRGGVASLCVGKGNEIEPRDFNTFCPKALAGIGNLPDTVADRSIPIRLERKLSGESDVQRFRLRLIKREAERISEQIAVWMELHGQELRDAQPGPPEVLTDRQQDCAEPLLAIADAAGGDWPELAREALMELMRGARDEDVSLGVLLLTDIKQIFDEKGVDNLATKDLIEALVEIETSP